MVNDSGGDGVVVPVGKTGTNGNAEEDVAALFGAAATTPLSGFRCFPILIIS